MYLKKKELLINSITVLIYAFISIIVYYILHDFIHIMLAWNILLAFLPFVFVWIFERTKNRKNSWILILLWFIFYPNSIYVITDLIYINSFDFIKLGALSIYNMNTLAYLGLFHILIGIIISLNFGMKSFRVVYYYVDDSIYKKYKNYFVLALCFFASTGVYIGRFFRYNSWDIVFHFWKIIKDFFIYFTWFSLFFIFSITLIQVFIFYFVKFSLNKEN